MSGQEYLALWCGVFGTLALVGYGLSLAGLTRAQRTVRVVGRIVRVREPRHGTSRSGGISVVVAFHDPFTGQEFTVTNDGKQGETITTAWTGREIGVHYPRGRPHAFLFTNSLPEGGAKGLGWPNFAVFLIYVGLVVAAAIDRGWSWALLGFGVPWTVLAAFYLPGAAREAGRRTAVLTSVAPVPGRVIAVLKDVSTDDDGHTSTTHTPVLTFTTHDGRTVLAHRTSGLPDPAGSYGRNLTVHYSPDDPAVFTPNLAHEHRSGKLEIVFGVLVLLVGVAAVAVGAALL